MAGDISTLLALLLLCECVWKADVTAEDTYALAAGSYVVAGNSITHDCQSPHLNKAPTFNQTITKASIRNCAIPSTSYKDELANLGFNVSTLDFLELEFSGVIFLKFLETQFQGLVVKKLILRYVADNNNTAAHMLFTTGKNVPMNVKEVSDFKANAVIQEIEIIGINVYGIFAPSIEKVTLSNSDYIGPWQNCEGLRQINATNWNFRNSKKLLTGRFLANCHALSSLWIKNMSQPTPEFMKNMLAGAKSLKQLVIQDSFLEQLDKELVDLVQLERLDVSHNQMHYMLQSTRLPALRELDLSHNHLYSSALASNGVVDQPALQTLILDYNPFLDLCDNLSYKMEAVLDPLWRQKIKMPSLKRLSIKSTNTGYLCFSGMTMDSLEYLDVGNNKITAIQVSGLPISKARILEVNFTGNPVESIPFGQKEYENLRQEKVKISGLNLTIGCDCESAWVARAAREGRLVVEGARCNDQTEIALVPLHKLECDKFPCGDKGTCTCRRWRRDNSTVARCHGALQSIPLIPGLRELHAAGNLVETVTLTQLPDSLVYVDLRHNHISRLGEAPAVALVARTGRRVRLQGNPFICDCANRRLIEAFHAHQQQIEDYHNITCVDDGRALRDLDTSALCSAQRQGALVACGALVGLGALAAAVYCRYGRVMKVFLYARGWCVCCVREEELDAERPYDAFVSFSHKDEAFVVEELLPVLERDPYNFKLCVHFRNWIPGELIPTQITSSVEQSRRTIIVISKNFLQSVWGLLEFRTAHVSALSEGRVRVIVVVLDDVADAEDLDAELRGYLRTNTYVRWGEPWFWDKLRFALPHHRAPRVSPSGSPATTQTFLDGSTTQLVDQTDFELVTTYSS